MSAENLTKEQIVEIYGDLPLKFSSYYKFSFTYSAPAPDGAVVSVSYGRSSDDIYRYDVTPDKVVTLRQGSEWDSAIITRDGQEIWSAYE